MSRWLSPVLLFLETGSSRDFLMLSRWSTGSSPTSICCSDSSYGMLPIKLFNWLLGCHQCSNSTSSLQSSHCSVAAATTVWARTACCAVSVDVYQPAVPCAMVWCVDCLCGVRAALMVATSTTSRIGWPATGPVQLAVVTSVNTPNEVSLSVQQHVIQASMFRALPACLNHMT